MNDIEEATCVKFIERSDEEDFVEIKAESEQCEFKVGRQGGVQTVYLDINGDCLPGSVKHEFLHALGFHHMQSSHNRDHFVEVFEDNILDPEKNAGNFDQLSDHKSSLFDTKYDFDSIMHSHAHAYSKGVFEKTIEALDYDYQAKIEAKCKTNLSEGDVQRVNNMYKCEL